MCLPFIPLFAKRNLRVSSTSNKLRESQRFDIGLERVWLDSELHYSIIAL